MNYTNQKLKANNLLKEGEKYITGKEWLKRAQALSEGLMNDEALEFYSQEKNWHLLPKTEYLFFPDTVFSDSDGDLCVRCLDWDVARWSRGYDWLDDGWSGRHPSASLASSTESSDVSPALESKPLDLPEILVINGVEYKKTK